MPGSRQQARAALARTLFPAASGPGWSRSRGEAALAVAALLLLGALLNLLRLGWHDSLNTVWAEDGPIYLQAALTQGFWHAVFSPYAGYLVLVPRLIGEVGAAVPLQQAPAAISIVSALLTALCGLAIWFASAGHVRDPYLRGALVLAMVLAASSGQEVLDSAAYVPWFMLAASFWLLFLRPRSAAGAVLASLFLLATGLSTPGVWFFLPLALLRSVAAGGRRDAILLAGYWLGAAVQVPVVMAQQQGPSLWTSHIWTAYLQRVLDGGLLGQRLGGNLWAHLGWPFLIALALAVIFALVYGLRQTSPGARWFAAIAIPTSIAMFVLSVYQRMVGFEVYWPGGGSGGAASRYVLVPAILLLSVAVVIVDGVVRRRGPAWRWRLIAPTIGLIVLAVAVSFPMNGPGGRGRPYWEEALRAAANRCLSQHEGTAGIAAAPHPYGMQIPCHQVASFAGGESSGP